MKFMVGYPDGPCEALLDCVLSHASSIREVYFPWPEFSTGRGRFQPGWAARRRLVQDLERLSEAGIGLDLLLNAGCYGAHSQARQFFEEIGDTVNWLSEQFGLKTVTTTSPLIAKFLHDNFTGIEVRGSVNLSLVNTDGLEYISSCFDSFYAGRECNRHGRLLEPLIAWCRQAGKGLFLLGNSGCLNSCSAHVFHDNLVAHEHEISGMDNGYEFHCVGREWLRAPEHAREVLRVTNFIRPEDVPFYEGKVSGLKLATRVHPHPEVVLSAYLEGHYRGNMLDLLEPVLSEALYPLIMDNSLVDRDFAEREYSCGGDCEGCGYCRAQADRCLVRV